MDKRPIGVFDSGVGGLSVAWELRRLAPRESIVYFADTAYFPYGPRPAAEVRKRAFIVTSRLLQSDVKLIVAACNTASAAALADLREAFDVPFVGMVPGVKPAAATSRSGHVTILATPGTLDGELYRRVVDEFGGGASVSSVAGDGLAGLVEAGKAYSAEARAQLVTLLGPDVDAGSDTIVLGCTHYHFLAGTISDLFPSVQVIDTSSAVARHTVDVLAEADLQAPPTAAGSLSIIVSGDRSQFRTTMAILGSPTATKEATA